jgi:hypothetical protein
MDDRIDTWIRRLGFKDIAEARQVVRESLTAYDQLGSRDASDAPMVLLSCASAHVAGGAGVIARRLRAGADHDFDRLVRGVAEGAAASPDPEVVFDRIAKWLVDEGRPLLSDDAYAGMARLAAAELRVREKEAAAARLVAKREPGPLIQSDVWRQLVAGAAQGGDEHWRAVAALFATLTTEEIEALADVAVANGSPADGVLARRILRQLRERNDGRLREGTSARVGSAYRSQLSAEHRVDRDRLEEWAVFDLGGVAAEVDRRHGGDGRIDQALWSAISARLARATKAEAAEVGAALGRIVRRDLDAGRAPFATLGWWMALAREEAAAFVADLDVAKLPEQARLAFVGPLQVFGTAEALVRLQQIQALGGSAGDQALLALEVAGAAPQDRIEALAAAWREKRSGALLRELHDRYIERVPAGTSFARWCSLLGVPATDHDFWVESQDGTARMFVQLDGKGVLTGLSFR